MISGIFNISLEGGDMPQNTLTILGKLIATKDDDGTFQISPEDK